MNEETPSTGSSAFTSALTAINPVLGMLSTAAGTAAKATGKSAAGVASGFLGNAVLVGVGVVLALGALLIGSRDTIVNVSSKVGKTARMFV